MPTGTRTQKYLRLTLVLLYIMYTLPAGHEQIFPKRELIELWQSLSTSIWLSKFIDWLWYFCILCRPYLLSNYFLNYLFIFFLFQSPPVPDMATQNPAAGKFIRVCFDVCAVTMYSHSECLKTLLPHFYSKDCYYLFRLGRTVFSYA